jgi:3-hydroxyacyl-CoA dehydrogenase
MNRAIKKAAILGSGVMGSRIACHLANVGVQVLLLDIVPKEPNDAEKAKGLDESSPSFRNRIVNESFQSAIKSNPAPLYHKHFAKRIRMGNFEDNMNEIKDADWIIEVVVENLEIKKKVFDQVEQFRTPGSFITTNTSGIPIHLMLEGRSEDFQKYFIGTHFFNPPRYLNLLEIIPSPKSDPEVVDFFMHYGDLFLGKTTVLCKDTPAFIANRVGIFAILKVIETMDKLKLNIDQIDKLTGPVIGRPKSATFRTSDVVGLDTLIKVAGNLHQGLVDDEDRDTFKLSDTVFKLEKNNWLGDKTGQGFYKKIKEKGKTQILTLDLDSFEYKPKQKIKFATLETTKPIDNLKERFKVLMAGKDVAGDFYRDSFFSLFKYVTYRIPEIADELYKIDDAVRAGFAWELGPFETWDEVGVKKSIEKMETAGYKPASWVYEMIEAGHNSFYTVDDGIRKYYDINSKSYQVVPGMENFVILDNIRQNGAVVWNNSGSTIFDLGNGVLNLEFHTKMNTMGSEVLEGLHKAIDMAEENYSGLVVGNQGAQFSAGANLGMVFMYAIEQEYDELNFMIKIFQDSMMKVRYSSIPVVVAPHGLALGGGCEMTLHADRVQAAAETYIGLVEVGVGLIPAGGGTKELTKRLSDSYEEGDVALNDLQSTFMNIATAKVATSAQEAFDMKILQRGDQVSVNRKRQIADAKDLVLELHNQGYTQPIPANNIKVHGKTALALVYAGVNGMQMGKFISDHDAKIAKKIAWVMSGGDLSYTQEVSEQYLLDLEREAFLSLCGEKKTLERIQAILQGGKPLRN